MKKLISIIVFTITVTYFANAQYVTNGSASLIGGNEFQLTPNYGGEAGSVWNQTKLNLNYDFSIAATLNLGTNTNGGADGIAFLLQSLSVNAIGLNGGGIGYRGISPSLDVEFDTYPGDGFGDPADDHLGINVNGSTDHAANSLLPAFILPEIEDGAWHTALFTWVAATKTFTVTFDGTPHSIVNDLVTNIFGGSPFAFWGFTGATGGSANDQRVRIGAFTIVEEIAITAVVTNVNCTSLGAIDATVTGGTGGTQYSWSGPGLFSNSNVDISGLAAGTYTLTVTDNSNTSKSKSFTVSGTEIPISCSITPVPTNNIYTGGVPTNIYLGYGPQSVRLNASASGGSGFNYTWTGNGSLSCTSCSNPLFTPTTAGVYNFNVHITNTQGCATDCHISICVRNVRVPGSNNKVYLCHKPSGNTGNPQSLQLAVSAVPAHLQAHSGDRLGICGLAPCVQLKESSDMLENNSAADVVTIKVIPNPSNGQFSVHLYNLEKTNAEVSILDINGALVEKRNVVLGSEENSFDFDLNIHASGLYYIKVITEDATYIEKAFIQR